MARNNAGRTGAPKGTDETTPETEESSIPRGDTGDSLSFVTPTEFVELPSQGKYYPPDHPLHNVGELEIRFMTAKDEDTLSSETLLKKGLAIERMMQNIIVDKSIKPDTLLLGDRSAILLAARASAYGADYETRVTCPACNTHCTHTFDLNSVTPYAGDSWTDFDISTSGKGTFFIALPKSGATVEVRLTTGRDEKALIKSQRQKKKYNLDENLNTETMKVFIVSVNNITNGATISKFIDNMPAYDSRYLKVCFKKVTPTLDTTHEFDCNACGYETTLEVPFTTDFFWPKQ